MYDIRADHKQNLLKIVIAGEINNAELQEGKKLILAHLKELKKGFTIINDISKMQPASPKMFGEIAKTQAFAVECGVGVIIRVVENTKSREQFQIASGKNGYSAIEVASLEEAYEMASL